MCKGISERVSGASASKPGQQALDVAVAVGQATPSQQGEGIASLAAQVPGATQASRREKQEGEQQGTKGGLGHASETRGRRGGWERLLKGGDEAGLAGGGQEQEAARTVLPSRAIVGGRR